MSSRKQVAGYILDKRIGKGSYATVWKGHVDGGNEAVAVKVVSRQTVTETAQLKQEVDVLRRISHENIVRFRDLKKSASHFYLVLEYCAGGDLSQFLRDRGRVPEDKAKRFLKQISAGLCVLHGENVIHRDLKPQNILLSNDSNDPIIKIADFGFARALQPMDMAATVCGSPLYMAPEILRHEPYGTKADLWSVGAILFEMLLGRPPYSGANPMQLLANIEKTDTLPLDDAAQALISADGQAFLRRLLVRLPQQRIASNDFARHDYVDLGELPDPKAHIVARPLRGTRPASPDFCKSPVISPREPLSAAKLTAASSTDNTAPFELVCEESPVLPGKKSSGGVDMRRDDGAKSEAPGRPGAAGGSPGGANDGSPAGDQAVLVQKPEDMMTMALPTPSQPAGGEPVSGPPADTLSAEETTVGQTNEAAANESPVRVDGAMQEPSQKGAESADAESPRSRPARAGVLEEYIVVAEGKAPICVPRAVAAVGRGRGGDFCENLSLTAHELEELGRDMREDLPMEALALFLRALGLLEKALNVSTNPDMCRDLWGAYKRILEASEGLAEHVRDAGRDAAAALGEAAAPVDMQAQGSKVLPNQAVFEHAIQQTKDAAVELSKRREKGGWEAYCCERLRKALLLLDLLKSEADGEDLSLLADYTAPIARLMADIDRLGEARKECPVGAITGLPSLPPAQCPVVC
eukprot:TRINITY_DN20815_c0_g1_i1.p1 TRINITY_DN20815_c0_g1~~TRINITY_DN20815_c0_g1_i1.p1  ORF type:complete len:696 (-),score=135.35 TRINITY_DN20815_c0_g1_i1:207-2294(-)